MSRRVGSDRAAKTRDSWSDMSTFFNRWVVKKGRQSGAPLSTDQLRRVCSAGAPVVRDRLAEGGVQRRLEGRLAVAVHRDDVPQDREGAAALRLGVDRLDV